jgi:hypothetical protein
MAVFQVLNLQNPVMGFFRVPSRAIVSFLYVTCMYTTFLVQFIFKPCYCLIELLDLYRGIAQANGSPEMSNGFAFVDS